MESELAAGHRPALSFLDGGRVCVARDLFDLCTSCVSSSRGVGACEQQGFLERVSRK